MSEKGEVGLLELVGAERASTRRRPVRERNLNSRVVPDQAGVDCAGEGGTRWPIPLLLAHRHHGGP